MGFKFNPFTGTLDIAGTSGSGGGVQGPPTSTDRAIATWNGTGGNIIQDNPDTAIQPSGAIEAQGFISNRNVNGTVTIDTDQTMVGGGLTLQPGANLIIGPGGELIMI